MATINLGAIKFNWKGAYNNSTAYAVDDVVSSGGNSYVCIQASQGNAVGDATAYWNIMSAKGTNGTNGTNGTDLTSTLTTQGDILYRDGSGLQRLPKGTAGQVLQMNSGATAPEYGTVSSDFVKLSDTSASGNPSSIAVSDIFTSDYKAYKILINNFYASSQARLYFRFTTTGANEVTSGYHQVGGNNYYRWSLGDADGHGNTREHSGSVFTVLTENCGTSISNSMYGELTLMNPRQSSEYRWVMAHAGVRAPNNYHYTQNWAGYQNGVANTYNGFMVFPSSGQISSLNMKVYGIK